MLDVVLSLIPGAKVSVVGVARNEETLEAHTYLERLVGELDQRLALIVDPMLATGGNPRARPGGGARWHRRRAGQAPGCAYLHGIHR
ncbi:hypothetical protein G6F55_014534 [Rhizopus delemar]|nr:hypothetical protein G6F55_014534 [Rhizopus delemar]